MSETVGEKESIVGMGGRERRRKEGKMRVKERKIGI